MDGIVSSKPRRERKKKLGGTVRAIGLTMRVFVSLPHFLSSASANNGKRPPTLLWVAVSSCKVHIVKFDVGGYFLAVPASGSLSANRFLRSQDVSNGRSPSLDFFGDFRGAAASTASHQSRISSCSGRRRRNPPLPLRLDAPEPYRFMLDERRKKRYSYLPNKTCLENGIG